MTFYRPKKSTVWEELSKLPSSLLLCCLFVHWWSRRGKPWGFHHYLPRWPRCLTSRSFIDLDPVDSHGASLTMMTGKPNLGGKESISSFPCLSCPWCTERVRLSAILALGSPSYQKILVGYAKSIRWGHTSFAAKIYSNSGFVQWQNSCIKLVQNGNWLWNLFKGR